MADLEARLACASACILQSPPNEVNDVFNNVRVLVGDDEALNTGILPALEQYNVEQFVSAQLPDKGTLMICQAGQVPEGNGRYIEPHSATSWKFDHLNLTASDPEDLEVDEECETIRKELQAAAQRYESEHLADGVSKVFTTHQTRAKRQAPETPIATASVPAVTEGDDMETEIVGTDDKTIVEKIVDTAESLIGGKSTSESKAQGATETADQIAGQDAEMAVAPSPAAATDEEDASTVKASQESDDSAVERSQTSSASDITADATSTADPDMAATVSVSQAVPEESPSEPFTRHFSLYFVGNKYNPSNFWTGRWRSSYTLDLSTSAPLLAGQVNINVHFFEQGNVQLATTFKPTLELPSGVNAQSSPADIAKAVIKAISKAEEEYQLELNEAYRELSEKTFRSLRRALPVTRQKMDWAKVANYRVGSLIGGKA